MAAADAPRGLRRPQPRRPRRAAAAAAAGALLLAGGGALLALPAAAFAAAALGRGPAPPRPAPGVEGGAPGVGASVGSGRPSSLLAGSTSAMPAREEGTQVALAAGAGWLPSLPQGCEDDFECNEGRANFPLQCCELPVMGKFCCEPGEPVVSNQSPAFVPLPVPAESPFRD